MGCTTVCVNSSRGPPTNAAPNALGGSWRSLVEILDHREVLLVPVAIATRIWRLRTPLYRRHPASENKTAPSPSPYTVAVIPRPEKTSAPWCKTRGRPKPLSSQRLVCERALQDLRALPDTIEFSAPWGWCTACALRFVETQKPHCPRTGRNRSYRLSAGQTIA